MKFTHNYGEKTKILFHLLVFLFQKINILNYKATIYLNKHHETKECLNYKHDKNKNNNNSAVCML